MWQRSCSIDLLVLCCTYTVAAALEYWLVNWLKQFDVNIPIFFAIIQNSAWPLQIYFYVVELRKHVEPRVITVAMYRSYFILGGLASFITISRMVGLSALPPSLYVICANTETVFETLLTRIVLKRKVRKLQWLATSLVVAGVAVALYDPETGSYGAGGGGDSSSKERNSIMIGVALSMGSRFASALNVILAEKLLGKDVKSKIGVSECSVANAVIPFFAVPLILLVIPEYKTWANVLYPLSPYVTAIVTVLLVSLALAKNIDRSAKFGIVTAASTIFFAGVDAFMKVIAGIGSFLFFGEKIMWPNVIGFGLVVLALVALFIDKRNQSKKNLKAEYDAALLKKQQSVLSTDPGTPSTDGEVSPRAIDYATSADIVIGPSGSEGVNEYRSLLCGGDEEGEEDEGTGGGRREGDDEENARSGSLYARLVPVSEANVYSPLHADER